MSIKATFPIDMSPYPERDWSDYRAPFEFECVQIQSLFFQRPTVKAVRWKDIWRITRALGAKYSTGAKSQLRDEFETENVFENETKSIRSPETKLKPKVARNDFANCVNDETEADHVRNTNESDSDVRKRNENQWNQNRK